MLLGIYGMFAVGKTTFLNNIMDELPDFMPKGVSGLCVVFADLSEENHYNPWDDVWDVEKNSSIWSGKQEAKLPKLAEMIHDHDKLWIVESARYFGGMYPHILDIHKEAGGGVRFIIPVCDYKTARKFLIDRCNKRGKTFRRDYWTEKRLTYESTDRYINVAEKRYEPAGIKCYARMIDYERTEWANIAKLLKEIVALPVEKWYNDAKSNSNQGKQRQRKDHDSETAVVRVPRI